MEMTQIKEVVLASRDALRDPKDDGRDFFAAACDAWGPGGFSAALLRVVDAEKSGGEEGLRKLKDEMNSALMFAALLQILLVNRDKMRPESLVMNHVLLTEALQNESGLEPEDFARVVDPEVGNMVYGEPTLN